MVNAAKLNLFTKWYFAEQINMRKAEIADLSVNIEQRIDILISPPKIFSQVSEKAINLDDSIINEITNWLEIADLGKIAQLNKDGNKYKDQALIRRAIKYGYGKKDDNKKLGYTFEEAKRHIINLYKEIDQFCIHNFRIKKEIPSKRLKGKTVFDHEGTLLNLFTLSTEELFDLFSHKETYSDSYKILNSFFTPNLNLKITKELTPACKKSRWKSSYQCN